MSVCSVEKLITEGSRGDRLQGVAQSAPDNRGIMSVARFKARGHLAWRREKGTDVYELWTNKTND